jgi:hypothetical protein
MEIFVEEAKDENNYKQSPELQKSWKYLSHKELVEDNFGTGKKPRTPQPAILHLQKHHPAQLVWCGHNERSRRDCQTSFIP